MGACACMAALVRIALTHGKAFFPHAQCSGVRLSASTEPTRLASSCSNRSSSSVDSDGSIMYCIARCRALRRSPSRRLGEAPASSSTREHASSPRISARCSGVWSDEFVASTSASRLSTVTMSSDAPCIASQCRGCMPYSSATQADESEWRSKCCADANARTSHATSRGLSTQGMGGHRHCERSQV